MPTPLDLDLNPTDIAALTSADAVAAFLKRLGYPTGKRQSLAPSGLGLGETERQVTQLEVLSQDEEGFLRVVFGRLKSVTAKARTDLVRVFGKDPVADHLLILTSDFDTLEFVLIEKQQRARKGAVGEVVTAPKARVFVVPRRWPEQTLRILRRLTYTMDDGLRQFDKLRSVFDAAHFSGTYFQNRALFADHYLETRLREDPTWKSKPDTAFHGLQKLMAGARERVKDEPTVIAQQELFDPIWAILGFRPTAVARKASEITADYQLADAAGGPRTVALTYPWERWLDGPDPNDPDRPAENPGAAVVTLLERGDADWAIVTNGRLWRLYSRAAHSRSTNFYEVDLQDALLVSGQTDPNEAFRYWWLFFRLEAFLPMPGDPKVCWLDEVAKGSREYASEVEKELKRRVFYDVVPMLASGFLKDRAARLKKTAKPTEAELEQIREGTLTLLYRLLFMLYAESRDLLPVREGPYYAISLKKLKEEVAAAAGVSITDADTKLDAEYGKLKTGLYEQLADPDPKGAGLFRAMASGRPAANVPKYNGGLFRLDPAEASDEREAAICEFLNTHRVPDYYLATALDRLARVEDPRTTSLGFVDYKSLGVRQLGSIYEGLLEFRLVIAEEDLAVKAGAGLGEYIPLAKARGKSSKKALRQVKKGEPILQRDNTERKSSGSYYTPDHIVEYIVENTVGPVLRKKLESLRPEFRKAEQTFYRHLENAKADPRITLAHAATAAYRERRKSNPAATLAESDLRAFALAETHGVHKGLVEQLFDFRVLDPAMGSGHFLVEAVDFITDELLDFLNAFPANPVMAAIDQTRAAILESLREQGIETDEFTRRQLTDVHLLKRHVLKRCIYGVDLNPLATELAKVSLWLDAFTLGAPLSFLDHHLRTGNSLIGSSLPDLEAAIHDQLFKIDESHLLRAVQHVLTVARLADATASEVAKSKQAFDEARKTLSGYAVLLDILVAQHFGHSAALTILQHGSTLDLTSRATFMRSLGKLDRSLVDEVASLAATQRCFHWDLEFPEVFYVQTGTSGARIERRAPGDAGFSAIVGNPPYDELSEHAAGRELPEKHFFAKSSLYVPTRGGRMNLFRFFIIRTLTLLRSAARHGFIVPMAILGDTFTEGTRRYMLEGGLLRDVVSFPQKDDPNTRVFFEAKLSTAILLSENHPRPEDRIAIAVFPRHVLTDTAKRVQLSLSEIRDLEPAHLAIPALDPAELTRWRTVRAAPRLSTFGDVAKCWLGELMTNASNDHLTSERAVGPRLLRGANINYYVQLDEPKQGKPLYLKEKEFLREYADDPRAEHHRHERVGFQESCPIDNWRRLIACRIQPGHYCVHKIRYFARPCRYDLYVLLAFFNSAMADWRFSITSTNNSLSEYAVNALPIARFTRLTENCAECPEALRFSESWETDVRSAIETTAMGAEAWPNSIHDALAGAGREMTRLAEGRQARIRDFSNWLFSKLSCDENRFVGITKFRGGQADFDLLAWPELEVLLRRNQKAFARSIDAELSDIQRRFERDAGALRTDQTRFDDLRGAIDRVVWQLVGLRPDGTAPSRLG